MDSKNEMRENGGESLRTSFFAFTTTRPVAITMVVIAVVVFGLVSYQRLSLSLMPEISYPTVTVRTEYPGTAPEEVETTVSRPVEQALGVVSGLVSISSISKAGVSDVILEFDWDTDLDDAMAQIREKLDRLYFPEEVKRPMMLRYDPSLDPIVRLAVYGSDDLYQLRLLAEQEVERELEKLPGVAAVRVKGGLEEEVVIELEEGKLAALNISLDRVSSRLAEENVNMAGGLLREGDSQFLVRTLNEFKSLDEIAALVVEERNGTPVRISDLGRVYRSHKEREVITRVGGRESVEIEIYKEADANVVTVANDIARLVYGTDEQRQFVEKMKAQAEGDGGKRDYAREKRMTYFIAHDLPEPVAIQTLFDQSVFIRQSIDEVRNTAILGGLLAVIVLFVFLNSVPSTLFISLAIPVSIIATFASMYLFGVSLNIMSLGGLALGVGMLVDNSIVVLESIFRCRKDGDDPVRAAVRGTGEVGGAVLASTLTTVAVFFPIVFVEGIAGQIFGDMALTVVFSLLTSLLVALFVIPMLASRHVRPADSVQAQAVRTLLKPSIGANLAALKAEVGTKSGAGPKTAAGLKGWFRILYLEIRSILSKSLIGLAALLVALLKGVLLLPAAVPFWAATVFWPKSAQKLDSLAADGLFFGRGWFDGFWPGLISFNSSTLASASGQLLHGLVSRGGRVRRTAKWAFFFPVASLYYLLRLLTGLLLEILSKAIIALGLVLVILVTGVISLVVMFLLPVVLPTMAAFNSVYSRVEAGYPRLLEWALNNRLLVTGSSTVLLLYCVFGLFPQLGRELIPEVHQGEFDIQAQLPVGTPLARTDQYLKALEKIALADPEVAGVSSVVGVEKTTNPTSDEGEHTGRLRIQVASNGSAAEIEERTIGRLRKQLGSIPDLQAKIVHPALFSFKTPIEVEIQGYDLATLRSLCQQTVESLSGIEGLYDVRGNIQPGNPEIMITYDRDQLARQGLNIGKVAELIRGKVYGVVPTRFSKRERRVDMRVKVREEDKRDVPSLSRLVVNPGAEVPLPLAAVASMNVNEGPNEIRRIDQQRGALVTANVSGRDLGSVGTEIGRRMESLVMPADFSWTIAGQSREMEAASSSMILALLLAVFLVYVVMASQFESLVHPLVILFTIPMALIGVALALRVTGTAISVVVFIGLIMLAGIVVNNAIVLVDYVNHLRRNVGLARRAAIVQAGSVRLRPILMTTITTVLGLLPMALGLGEGAEIRTPMAVTVIAGLTSSTLLTLIVIPVVYDLMDWRE